MENKGTEIKTPIEETDKTSETTNNVEEQRTLGECRIHPPTPVPITSKDGKNSIGTPVFGGNKPVIVYEHPPCVGEECESHWCGEHLSCINICKYYHEEYIEEKIDGEPSN